MVRDDHYQSSTKGEYIVVRLYYKLFNYMKNKVLNCSKHLKWKSMF